MVHSFENIWRIDYMRQCGTHGLVKHKREVCSGGLDKHKGGVYSGGKVFQFLISYICVCYIRH